GHVQRHPLALGEPLLGRTPQIELHLAVHPINALVVPLRMGLFQRLAALVEAPAGRRLDQAGQRRDELGVTHRPVQRRRIPGRAGQPHAIARPAQGAGMNLDEEPHRLALLHRPYSFSAIRSFIAALSSASSAYIRLSLAFSDSKSLTRLRSDASIPPYFDFHW